jgi:NCAIR mutase (PurE)-related protein
MDRHRLENLLNSLLAGEIDTHEALERLKDLPYQDLGFAHVDSHRTLRQGLPEVIFSPGKTAEQIASIASTLRANHKLIVATKASRDIAEQVLKLSPDATYLEQGQIMVWGEFPQCNDQSPVVNVVTAGTADLPVAEEVAVFLAANGVRCERLYDVGVAGIHRLLGKLDRLKEGMVTVVVAGMDGALPSVVGGLVAGPVIAVPTSVGYGASFGGIAALLTMLNSCAAGITVVNIDNGFGAAVAALRLLSALKSRVREKSQ